MNNSSVFAATSFRRSPPNFQHNIMAMNAYRNYNNNTSALSKNLEKLSSGYKINRAGDDAAGKVHGELFGFFFAVRYC